MINNKLEDLPFHPWLVANLVCPISKSSLEFDGNYLISELGDRYPVVGGIPVMLPKYIALAHGSGKASVDLGHAIAQMTAKDDGIYLETLGISATEKSAALNHLCENSEKNSHVDPVVSALIGATSGYAYKNVINNLNRVPIPTLPRDLRFKVGDFVLDLGCNWGRWSVALCQQFGVTAIGLDPQLGAVAAASRLAKQRGFDFIGVVGDGAALPFSDACLSGAVSYSVLQHFPRIEVTKTVNELGRCVAPVGQIAIQMPNRVGIRCLYHQARRGFSDGTDFDVRYWSKKQLSREFGHLGEASFQIDCFFGLGLQGSDTDLMTPLSRAATNFSEFLKNLFGVGSKLTSVADSLWYIAIRSGTTQAVR